MKKKYAMLLVVLLLSGCFPINHGTATDITVRKMNIEEYEGFKKKIFSHLLKSDFHCKERSRTSFFPEGSYRCREMMTSAGPLLYLYRKEGDVKIVINNTYGTFNPLMNEEFKPKEHILVEEYLLKFLSKYKFQYKIDAYFIYGDENKKERITLPGE